MAGNQPGSEKNVGAAAEPCPLKKCSIVVQVQRSDNKEAVAGANVEIKGATTATKTTAQGSGRAVVSPAKAGNHSASISLAGSKWAKFRQPNTARFSVSPGEEKVVILLLMPPGSLQVQIIRADTREAVREASATLTGPENPAEKPVSSAGSVDYNELASGLYSIEVLLKGKAAEMFQTPAIRQIKVEEGQAAKVTVELRQMSWIELELLDEKGAGMPNEPYWIRMENGDVREGRLNAQGFARLENAYGGICAVRFPGRDQSEFVSEGSTAAPEENEEWIEIELLGDAAQPAAGEPYEIQLSDGTVRKGILDSQGKARLEGLPFGTCAVKFPNLEEDEFE